MNSTAYIASATPMTKSLSKMANCGGSVTQSIARGEAEDGHRRVEVDACREREAQRPPERRQQFHQRPPNFVEHCADLSAYRVYQLVAPLGAESVAVSIGGPEPHPNRHRLNDRAALPHRLAGAGDGDRDDRRACARSAITNAPFLNGSSSPVRLRVPSGNTRNEKPFPSRSTALIERLAALLAIAALDRHEADEVEPMAEDGDLLQLRLVEDQQARQQLVQNAVEDRRLDVAAWLTQ